MKTVGWIVSVVLVLILGVYGYLMIAYPSVEPASDMKVELTKERIERGRYLANHVVVCMDCHGTRDWKKFAGPPIPGTEGIGGEIFDQNMGLPGTFVSRNITPHGIESWSDGELYRLITTGVTKDDEPIFPIMPYSAYGKMDPEDVKSIIAYLRTLEPVEKELPPSEPDFPVNLVMRTMPKEAQPMEKPDTSDHLAYGKYLVQIAACADCHTPFEQGSYDMSKQLAGGRVFKLPSGRVTSANITSDEMTGIGRWTSEEFVDRFKSYDFDYKEVPELQGDMVNTVMPWTMYADMKESDLIAIYLYLQSVDPISNDVEPFAQM